MCLPIPISHHSNVVIDHAPSVAKWLAFLVPRSCWVLQVRYVLKNLVRDWSAEGVVEREQCYGRIITKLKECFSSW